VAKLAAPEIPIRLTLSGEIAGGEREESAETSAQEEPNREWSGMVALCAVLLGPWVASTVAIVGTLAATVVNHSFGASFGKVVEERAPRALLGRMRSLGRDADMLSLAGLRLIPIAPFSVVNLIAGAMHVRLRWINSASQIEEDKGKTVNAHADRGYAYLFRFRGHVVTRTRSGRLA
jgi:hypothetical protein